MGAGTEMDTKQASIYVWAPPYTSLPLEEWDEYDDLCSLYGKELSSYFKEHTITWDVFNTEAIYTHLLSSRLSEAELSVIWIPLRTSQSLRDMVTEVSRHAQRMGSTAIFLKQVPETEEVMSGVNHVTVPREYESGPKELRMLHDVSIRVRGRFQELHHKQEFSLKMLVHKTAAIIQQDHVRKK